MVERTIFTSRTATPAKKSECRYAARSMVRTTCAALSRPACATEREDSTDYFTLRDEKKLALPARVQAATGKNVALTALNWPKLLLR